MNKAKTEKFKGVSVKAVAPPSIKEKKKIRVLWYSDFLRCTGFGNLAEELISRLDATGKYEFTVLAINHTGDAYNHKSSPYYKFKHIPVYPAFGLGSMESMYGFNKLQGLIAQNEFDILFAIQDTFNMAKIKDLIEQAKEFRKFKYMFYYPVDGNLQEAWVKDAVKVADKPVVYTEFGKRETLKIDDSLQDLAVMPHGVDLNVFQPFTTDLDRDTYRETNLHVEKDCFLITNVNRNQPRKDLPRFLLAYREFVKRYPEINSKVYLHALVNDSAGFDLKEFCKQNLADLDPDSIMFANQKAFGLYGIPKEELARIYAASDVISSTTLGEGWGFSTTEAMACGTPVAMPDNTATTEIIGGNEERGYLVNSGNNPNLYTVIKSDNDQTRPLTDVDHLVETWKHIYDNRVEAKKKADAAREWIKGYSWDVVADKWDRLITEQYNLLNK